MLFFPHPLSSDEDGLLAIGGQLSIERLSLAYSFGIFPWFNQAPILWWYTHPRAVIYPNQIKISKSMRNILRKPWRVTMDTSFEAVMRHCRNIKRNGQNGTWITDEIMSAYMALHQVGKAHSIEVWEEEKLIGGLYGVVSGQIFCGESMFANVSNASKVALIYLCQYLEDQGCSLIDCQQDTEHMRSMGSVLINKEDYWDMIKSNTLVTDMYLSERNFSAWWQANIAHD